VPSDPILYDADCGFCRWSLGVILAWDRQRRLRPVALQDQEADELLRDVPPDSRMRSWHLVTGEGVSSAGAGAVPLLRRLPGGRPLAALANRVPRATERGYRWVAEHRSTFSRLVPGGAVARADARIRERRR
jgi:predicted DCC family thiol-disulfide oxidoreductase YuxK